MVDWWKIIYDLQRSGMTHKQQASSIGVSRRTIGYWQNGHEPPYSKGVELIELHKSVINST